MIIFPLLLSFIIQTTQASVDLDSGFVRLNFVDLQLGEGNSPLVFSRTYNSNERLSTSFGKGMAVKLATHLKVQQDRVFLHDFGHAEGEAFTPKANNLWQSERGALLYKKKEIWEFTEKETRYIFSSAGKLRELIYAGTHLIIEWDGDKLVAIKDPLGATLLKVQCNDKNLVTRITNSKGQSCEYAFDEENRLVKFVSPTKEVFEYKYGPYGLTELTRNKQALLRISYNKNSRVSSYEEVGSQLTTIKEEVKVEGGTERLTFRITIKAGDVSRSLVRENHFRRTGGRKLFTRKIETINPGPMAQRREVVFSAEGRPIKMVNNEVQQEVQYDPLGRPILMAHSVLGRRQYEYAPQGQLLSVEEKGKKYKLSYAGNLLVSVQGPDEAMELIYKNREIRMLKYRSKQEQYLITYDREGRMEKLSKGGGQLVKIVYQGPGEEVKKIDSVSAEAMDKLLQIRNRFEHLFLRLPDTSVSGHF